MTASPDNPDRAMPLLPPDGRQSPMALDIARGVGRVLRAHGLAFVAELALANGRRADIAGLTATGDLWIVEIKSGPDDFRSDEKWPDYRAFCDELLFAVAPDFPRALLPDDVGLIVADRYGGEIVRRVACGRLPAARRKAMHVRFARAAALRLAAAIDPDPEARIAALDA